MSANNNSMSNDGDADDWLSSDDGLSSLMPFNDTNSPPAPAADGHLADTGRDPELIHDDVGPALNLADSTLLAGGDFETQAPSVAGIEEIHDEAGPFDIFTETIESKPNPKGIEEIHDDIGPDGPTPNCDGDAEKGRGIEEIHDFVGPEVSLPNENADAGKRRGIEEIHDRVGPNESTLDYLDGNGGIGLEEIHDDDRRVDYTPNMKNDKIRLKNKSANETPVELIAVGDSEASGGGINLQERRDEESNLIPPPVEIEQETRPRSSSNDVRQSAQGNDAVWNVNSGVEAGNEQEDNPEGLPHIPEAYVVDETQNGNNDIIISGHATPLIPWYKQRRVICFFIFLFVLVAVAVGAAFALNRPTSTTNEVVRFSPTTNVPTTSYAPSVSYRPTVEQTTTPSTSLEPSASPTACTDKIVGNSQQVDIPLVNPFNVKISVDGNDMAIGARELNTGDAHVIFYTLTEAGWQLVAQFIENDYVNVHSIAISGSTALVGLDSSVTSYPSGFVFMYEKDSNGDWQKNDDPLSNGLHVDISGDLACALPNIFRKSVTGWEQIYAIPNFEYGVLERVECIVAGLSVFVWIDSDLSFYTYDPDIDAITFRYSLDKSALVPFQDANELYKRLISASMTPKNLVYSAGLSDQSGECLDVFIYERQDANDQFSFHQHLNASNYQGLGRCSAAGWSDVGMSLGWSDVGMSLDIEEDLMAIGGYNQTFIFAKQNAYWEEALVLDGSFTQYKLSGRNLIASANNEVHYFNIVDCVQSSPTSVPSSSIHPTATTQPSTTMVPSTSPTEMCSWVHITIPADENPQETTWEIHRVGSSGLSVEFSSKSKQSHGKSLCLKDGLYEFVLFDYWAFSDYNVTSNGKLIAPVQDATNAWATMFNSESRTKFYIPYDQPILYWMTSPPTSSDAPSSTVSPTARPSSLLPTVTAKQTGTCYQFEVTIDFSDWNGDISDWSKWSLTHPATWNIHSIDADGNLVRIKAFYPAGGSPTQTESICLEEGTYRVDYHTNSWDRDSYPSKILITSNGEYIAEAYPYERITTIQFGIPLTSAPSSMPTISWKPSTLPSLASSLFPSTSQHPSTSFLPTVLPSASLAPTKTCFVIEVNIDYYWLSDVMWTLQIISEDSDFAILKTYDEDDFSGAIYTESFCIPPGEYQFTIDEGFISFGGYYSITYNGMLIGEGGNYVAVNYVVVETTIFSVPYVVPTPAPSTSQEPSMSLLPTMMPSVSLSPTETCSNIEINVEYPWSAQIQWKIQMIDENGDFAVFKAYEEADWDAISYSGSVCIPDGDYQFNIEDGIYLCFSGYYNITQNGNLIGEGGWVLAAEGEEVVETTMFSMPFVVPFKIRQSLPGSDINDDFWCVDLRAADTTNGNDVWYFSCNDSPAQHWYRDYIFGYIRSSMDTNKCLIPERIEKEARIVIWDCEDEEEMRWDIGDDGSIRPRNDDRLCLQASTESDGVDPWVGFYLILDDCRDEDYNTFDWVERR